MPAVSRIVGALAAATLVLLVSSIAAAAEAPSDPGPVAGDARRGHALYDGRVAMRISSGQVGDTATSACVACHRPSGMGNFEGGLAVPPIAGPMLFQPLDRDTAHFFRSTPRFRVRPAYDQGSLGHLLREGVTPDAVILHAAMPRYALSDVDLADLTAYLRGLSASPPPGLDADSLRVATITTPDADPVRRDAMLATMRRFIERKNAQSRHEVARVRQSGRTREMVTYRKYRQWQLVHWALQGPPDSWGDQLDALQAREQVFAVVGGLGRAEWAPIDAFCGRQRLPCLLPMVEAGSGGVAPNFYALHYHAGIDDDAALAAGLLRERGVRSVVLWADVPQEGLARRVARVLDRAGLHVDDDLGAATDVRHVVSLLDPAAHAARLQAAGARLGSTTWLAGTHALGRETLAAVLPLTKQGWVISPMRTGATLDVQLQRTRTWLHSQGMDALPVDVAATSLQSLTALGEGLAHLDFDFSQDYLLELLEHGLENLVPWGPYPRLTIGPGQRIASKGSWLGEVHDGAVAWRWRASP